MPSINALKKLVHTIRYLRPKQCVYQLYYRCIPPIRCLPAITTCTRRIWKQSWSAPLSTHHILKGAQQLCFLGESIDLADPSPDFWSPATRSKLWVYNLHYFDVLNTSEAQTEPVLMNTLIDHWIVHHGSMRGVGWEPYPTSLRMVNWITWFSKYPHSVKPEWLQSLDQQAQVLRKRVEYHLLANHVFENAKALIFVGTYLDGKSADRYLKQGLKILDRELVEQFLNDGGHVERSPMYHATLLHDLCDLVHLAQCCEHPALLSRKVAWQSVIQKGLLWLEAMSHPDGEIAFFNDAAFGIAPRVKELKQYAARHLLLHEGFPQAITDLHPSNLSATLFLNSGYCTFTFDPQSKLILDTAPIGPDYQPGHAHADTLSFELSLEGQRVFVNSGTSTYALNPQRAFERSTTAHNTITINGADSSEVWAGFRVAKRAYPIDFSMNSKEGGYSVRCGHTGYLRLKGRPIHHRTWDIKTNSLHIHDVITGHFKEAVSRLHLHPDVQVQQSSDQQIHCTLANGKTVEITVEKPAKIELKPATWHPYFGSSIASTCVVVVFSRQSQIIQITW